MHLTSEKFGNAATLLMLACLTTTPLTALAALPASPAFLGYQLNSRLTLADTDTVMNNNSDTLLTDQNLAHYNGVVFVKSRQAASPFKQPHVLLSDGRIVQVMASDDSLNPAQCQNTLQKEYTRLITSFGPATKQAPELKHWKNSAAGYQLVIQCQAGNLLGTFSL
ncbi:hypothetical protein [Tatumella citrea]|uniref:Uncharacterized protein n=1 Tax=Tatumella citrea TaxID=53336 RepID=A0A1Y0L868_TATCI|nr:hypothetical protein [Tatumella citrea]ARU93955.1 hypothetical protein A7K98_09300 [Tatumella citrea]ARU97993.1 hypothetical protein A7K99_09300 [Tatumella citrea]